MSSSNMPAIIGITLFGKTGEPHSRDTSTAPRALTDRSLRRLVRPTPMR